MAIIKAACRSISLKMILFSHFIFELDWSVSRVHVVVRVFLIICLHDAYPKSVVSSATDLHGTSGGECYR